MRAARHKKTGTVKMEIPKSQFLKLKLRRLLKNTAVGNKHEGPSFPFRLFQRSAQHWTRPLHIFSGGYYIRGRFEMQLEKMLENIQGFVHFFGKMLPHPAKNPRTGRPPYRPPSLPPATISASVKRRRYASITSSSPFHSQSVRQVSDCSHSLLSSTHCTGASEPSVRRRIS